MDGGLELMLPGKYFETMRAFQRAITEGTMKEFGFEKIKIEFMRDYRNTEHDYSHIPKIGYALQSFEQIENAGFTYLVDARFKRVPDKIDSQNICQICGLLYDPNHIMRCKISAY
jgi:queuine/archaeosine tRNA-ribosyltransferase